MHRISYLYVSSLGRKMEICRRLSTLNSNHHTNCICGLIKCLPSQCPSSHYNNWPVIPHPDNLAPYMGSSWETIDTALDLVSPLEGKSLIDLGCGDGRIIIRALQRGIRYAEGWELNQSVYELAKSHVSLAHPSSTDRYRIIHDDLRKAEPWKYDIVTMFLIPSGLEIAEAWLKKHMVSACRDDYKTVEVLTVGWKFSTHFAPMKTAQSSSGTSIYKYQIDLKLPKL
jgi:SAM-dependent methyltransferase